MKRFRVVTLGCRTNQYESQGYSDQLRQMGYVLASDQEEVDLCVVNTCTVTEGADSSSRHQIRAALRGSANAKVVVTGCMAEKASEALLQMDSRIQIVPNAQKEQLVNHLFPEEKNFPEFNIQAFDDHTRAFVKVQDGCNSFCTYCIIPYVRGRSRSRSISDVVKEVERLVANGYKEVVITGINVGDFDGGGRLADLVRSVDSVKGLQRLRISSIDPDEVDDDLTHAVIHGKTTCPSMHIVLQAGSNVTLKRMNRKYTRQMFIDSVERMVQKMPDFTVTTDIIVGFPGETESDFCETLDLVNRVKFAKVHMFPYSPRQKTRAALYPNKVPQEVIRRRKQELLRLTEKCAFELRERFVGRKMEVLLEKDTQAGVLSGHTANFLRVRVPSGSYKPNDLIVAELIGNEPDGLVGRAG